MPLRIRQAWRLLAAGRLAALAHRVSRALATEALPVRQGSLNRWIGDSSFALVVDGSHGGGARLAADRRVTALLAAGIPVLLLGVGALTGRLQVSWYQPGRRPRGGSLASLPDSSPMSPVQIHVDTLVGFLQPYDLLEWLCRLRESSGAELQVYWHDHHAICPSSHLLNGSGKWCGVPSPAVCARCLPGNSHCRNPALRTVEILDWRRHWQSLLIRADRVRVYSRSSERLLESSFPDVSPDRIYRQGHAMDYFPVVEALSPVAPSRLHIGVMGHIAEHKGSQVVLALAQAIANSGADVRMTVFGSLEGAAPPACVVQSGSYTLVELPQKVRDAGVNIVFVPSVWPETFSYVTHEALQLGLPVVGFDLGAQGEALKDAERGLAVPLRLAEPDNSHELLAVLTVAATGT